MDRMKKTPRSPSSSTYYIAAITYTILGISVLLTLLGRASTWRRQITWDIVACSTCLALQYHLPQTREVWILCLALGHATWNLLPGSFTSLDMPTHSTFMRTVKMQDEQADCIVCWDTDFLAQLPCGHVICKPCLQLMGKHFQTACPMCRRPLFSALDWPVLGAMKSAVTSLAITIPLCFLDAIQEISGRHYRNAAVWMGCFYINLFLLWVIVTRMVIPR
jgi:hypothetical protein